MTARRTLLRGLGASLLAAPALAQRGSETRLRWRMATSWPKGLAGPGIAAQFIARRVSELSEGRFEISLFSAGEIVPAFQVLDAVSQGTIEMGHSASLFWQGKMAAAPLFSTFPFGPDPIEHQAWLNLGGGQALWDEMLLPYGVKAMLGGNTGPSMGGWFKREISGLADVKGLKLRVQGLGAELWSRLGATPVSIAPGDLLISLGSGVIDGVEFLAPINDLPLGLYKPAPFYYAPGFNKPNGAAETLVNLAAWEKLPQSYQRMIETASQEAHARGLAEAYHQNGVALQLLVAQHGVMLRRFPNDLIEAARMHAKALIEDLAAKSPLNRKIIDSIEAMRSASRPWSRITLSGQIRLSAE
jgi:TRAP-type mannitol/chloroaromatic compound transport system substrate-binding protein